MVYQAGTEAIVSIAHFFFVRPDGAAQAVSMVDRDEFERTVELMAASGVPIVADRDEAWATFVTMRSAYEQHLLGLDKLILPPAAPWSRGIDPADPSAPLTSRR